MNRKEKADIAMAGLGVMGANLARNMKSRGFSVAVFDTDEKKTAALAEEGFLPAESLRELAGLLETPRKIFMMVPAGEPVDMLVSKLSPLLSPGDILIDGGNSNFKDTDRRVAEAEKAGLLYVGCGVSGGEKGALTGPSMMPGGSKAAWPLVRPVLTAVCAKTPDGIPCCSWMGEGGAGHFVKMVHNGIEYGDIQLICESYDILRKALHLSNEEMSGIFSGWNRTGLESYLIEITGKILAHKEPDGIYTVDRILDRAGQKGTGKWTGMTALEEDVSLNLITEAVSARFLSARKKEREALSALYPKKIPPFEGDKEAFIEKLQKALYTAKLFSYAQGFDLLRAASVHYGWQPDYAGIARSWEGGCIIRSAFLSEIRKAYEKDPALPGLLCDGYFRQRTADGIASLREVTSYAVLAGIPVPAFSAGLAWFDGSTDAGLPANLLQAMRDFFGAHTYERTDRPEGMFFHTDWQA